MNFIVVSKDVSLLDKSLNSLLLSAWNLLLSNTKTLVPCVLIIENVSSPADANILFSFYYVPVLIQSGVGWYGLWP